MDNRYNCHNRRKYSLKVHIVLVTKYRKQILKGSIADDVKQKIFDISNIYGYEIIAMETEKDHIHFLLSYDTTDRVCDIMKSLCMFSRNRDILSVYKERKLIMEYSEPIYEFHNAKLVSVIASFNTDGKVKPLYVRMNEEPVKVLSSKVIQTTLHMIAFEVIVDDYGRQRIIRLLYKTNESVWYANVRT